MVLFWFRRDLRLDDNIALYKALTTHKKVQCIFIFDKNILNKLPDKTDKRVEFIHQQLEKINHQLKSFGSSLWVYHNSPTETFDTLTSQYTISDVYSNEDYEPYALERDQHIKLFLEKKNIGFHQEKDQVIFHKNDVLKKDGTPYTVYTPYSKEWKRKYSELSFEFLPVSNYKEKFHQSEEQHFLSLKDIGFKSSTLPELPLEMKGKIDPNYAENRDFPALDVTSKLSVALRFGTLSIRKLAIQAKKESPHFLNELIWREFFQTILYHRPNSAGHNFKPAYDHIEWENNETHFKAWCEGKTGYPMVDAGMRELNTTGLMHNRVRMVVASFLCKHLLIDWRWGAQYFAEKLLDFDLASNAGNWQWAAGTGCDSAPYFRVFNPEIQLKKFDPKLSYTRKWIPEIDDPFEYPKPIVEHKFARERAIERYKKGLQSEKV